MKTTHSSDATAKILIAYTDILIQKVIYCLDLIPFAVAQQCCDNTAIDELNADQLVSALESSRPCRVKLLRKAVNVTSMTLINDLARQRHPMLFEASSLRRFLSS